jgi:hypothetical protein
MIDVMNERKGRQLLNYALALVSSNLRVLKGYSTMSVRLEKEIKDFVHVFGYNLLHMSPKLVDVVSLNLLCELMLIDPALQFQVHFASAH